MKQMPHGFSLVELLIAVAVVGILAAVAVPSYMNYLARSRISEGVFAALPVKVELANPFDSSAALAAAAATANALPTSTKYVRSIRVTPATGMITITFDETRMSGISAATNTITLTPYVSVGAALTQLGTAATTGLSGKLLWGCASSTGVMAASHGTTPLAPGTLPAMFAPAECR